VAWIQSENILDIEESDKHFLHLWLRRASFLGSWGCWLFPLQTLSFALGITLQALCFISNDISTRIFSLIDCKYRDTHQRSETQKHTRLIIVPTSTFSFFHAHDCIRYPPQIRKLHHDIRHGRWHQLQRHFRPKTLNNFNIGHDDYQNYQQWKRTQTKCIVKVSNSKQRNRNRKRHTSTAIAVTAIWITN